MADPKGVINFTGASAIDPATLSDPSVDGVSVGDAWYALEPTEGNFDFSRLDALINQVAAAGKYVLLRIATGGGGESSGGNKPNWLMTAVGANTFTFIDGDDGEKTIPWFWDETYLAAKIAMITAVGERYAGNPAVKIFACHFANANSEDWAVPTGDIPDGVAPPGSTMTSRWVSAGYTHALMADAGKQIIDAAMQAFPNQTIYMAVGNGKVKSLTLEPDGQWALATEVLQAARSLWGNRFMQGHNSHNAQNGATQLELTYPPCAAQNLWKCFGDPQFRMMPRGNPDNLTPDQILRMAFDLAKEGAYQWLEVYQVDVVNLAGAIAYGHSLLNPDGGVPEPPPPIPPPPGGIEQFPLTIRPLKFREVIWGVAHKMGWMTDCEPATGGPSDDQFCELVSFCNAWIRRLWDMEDWEEWTRISEVKPDSDHFVANPGRVLRMFLVNPRLTPGLVEDAPFTMFESRVHCGFEHGTSVWLKYIQPPPMFTHEVWSQFTTYSIGSLVYSRTSGECYRSIADNNRGHDPAPITLTGGRADLDVEVTQEFVAEVEPIPPVSEVWHVRVDSPVHYDEEDTVYRFDVTDADGVHHVLTHTIPPGGETLVQLTTGIIADFAGIADPYLNALAVSSDDFGVETRLIIENTTARFSVRADVDPPSGPRVDLTLTHISTFHAGRAGQDMVPQLAVMTLDAQFELLPTTYTIRARERDGQHQVGYTSERDEDLETTLTGIIGAINAAATGDPFWGEVIANPDADTNSIEFLTTETVEFRGTAEVQSDPNVGDQWEQVVFPQRIAEPVMNGMYQDALREEGQTDKALAEAPVTERELVVATSKSVNQPFDRLTQQQAPRSRYR